MFSEIHNKRCLNKSSKEITQIKVDCWGKYERYGDRIVWITKVNKKEISRQKTHMSQMNDGLHFTKFFQREEYADEERLPNKENNELEPITKQVINKRFGKPW